MPDTEAYEAEEARQQAAREWLEVEMVDRRRIIEEVLRAMDEARPVPP